MKALVTFALGNEFKAWRKARKFCRVSNSDWDQTYYARVGSVDVRVIVTGAGRFAAQRAMMSAFQDRPNVCIASGLSGGLKAAHRVGEVLVARGVADVKGTRSIYCDAGLVRRADEAGAKPVEKFLVSDRVVSTASQKQSLGETGDAVDMESLYILGAAAHHGVQAVAIRAISDDASSDLPLDFDRVFNEEGAVSLGKVIGQAAMRPNRIGGLLRLAHQSERAAEALAEFFDRYFEGFREEPLTENAKAAALAL
jgi:adenosylhomocysteine nucleosidase